jgi:hypothetical protein
MITIKKKIALLILIISTVTYLFLRLSQGFSFVGPYFNNVLNIVLSREKVSYDEKMFQLMGLRYLYPKIIKDVTSENATVCFWEDDALIDSSVAAYFIYPRIAKKIVRNGQSALDEINAQGCTHVVIHEGLPNFNMKVKEVVLFGNKLDDRPTIIKTSEYLHKEVIYTDKVGVIRL